MPIREYLDGFRFETETKRADLPDSPRCKTAVMLDILSIAPTLHQPGLIAFECPNCGYVTSVLQQPADHRTGEVPSRLKPL